MIKHARSVARKVVEKLNSPVVSDSFSCKQKTHIFSQQGQVLLLGLILCGAGVLAWILMLELGQRIHDQSSLYRAADAAAYSAALIQARSMNLHAYLNRAQLAHQLGMAHLVAVATAAQYQAKLANQAARRNPPASLIGAFFGHQHALAYSSASSYAPNHTATQHALKDAYLRHERQVHEVLDQVRQLQIKDFSQQREQAIHRMLILNIGHSDSALKGDTLNALGLKVALTLDETQHLVEQHLATHTVWRDFLTSLVSQYEYLNDRDQIHRNAWLVNPRCPHKRHELRRLGRLKLSEDGQWISEETLSFHALRHNKIIGCYHREYPMGWADLQTYSLTHQHIYSKNILTRPDFSHQSFWRWSRAQGDGAWNIFSGKSNPLAKRYGKVSSTKWQSKGLGRYTQLKKGREHHPVRIALHVSQQVKPNVQIQTEATAQTYFSPPQSAQSTPKIPSLFEPYWRATLIPNLK